LQINPTNQQTIPAIMHDPDDWNDYLNLLKVTTCGSLKVASQQLGINHSTVFRRINRLEKKLGVRLFERSKSGSDPAVSG
jgi:DNA-binding transcriptional LysR family regulator